MQITPTAAREKTIFVIDDDKIIRVSCLRILEKNGYTVEAFSEGNKGIERLREVRPPVLVVDIKMPELDGFEVIRRVREIDPDIVVVVITGYATIETAVDAMKAGAYDFLPKPFTPSELQLIIDRGLERWRLTQETRALRWEKAEVVRKFVTLVSHQLKSPLAAVKQYLDILLDKHGNTFPENTIEWISRSEKRIADMLVMINDWLMLSKIEKGSMAEIHAVSDLTAIVESVAYEYRNLPSASDISLFVEKPPPPVWVRGDWSSLNMLTGNLVGNAIKYNKKGGAVTVRMSRVDDRQVKLEVIDTGIGIPPEYIQNLFEEFYRVKTPETRNISGTGLGLVICKRIVDELGGSIRVESVKGEGATFTVLLQAVRLKEND
ncbi:MAG TPA: hybrid sensor histidine kinase/response regulator [Acidobacteriota bacterium]|nr:hybrid sensor histidine kinase/response regulator [Acidobacteriota bacterium]